MAINYLDENNQLYYDITYFFDAIYDLRRKEGISPREAKRCAFDAVELRYGMKYSRARIVIAEMHRNNKTVSYKDKSRIMCENRDLIEMLKSINDEYNRH